MENLQIGKKDPNFGVIVKIIALTSSEVHVFIDVKNEIFYIAEDHVEYCQGFTTIHSKVRRLESLVLSSLDKKKQENYNYLLANILADTFDNRNSSNEIIEELKNIEKDIEELVSDNQKVSFSNGTNISGIFIIFTIMLFHIFKYDLEILIGENEFAIAFSSLFGGIGALIFNYSKSKTYKINRVLGRRSSFFEGVLRIFYGTIYALIVSIGIKSNIIMGVINQDFSLYKLVFISIISGASDTFISGIVKSIEEKSKEKNGS